jgi:serine/threonine protein kinase
MLLGKEYNCTSDFWSYGILLTEMSTCQTPFYNSVEEKLHENIITKAPVLNAIHDEDLKDLITKLLDKNPDNRIGNPKSSYGKIQDHPFFKSKISWKELNAQTIQPPFVPELVSLS